MEPGTVKKEFRPELLSRRGEWTAWGLAALIAAGWLYLSASGRTAPLAVPIVGIFFLLSALSISLGNWMDRSTQLRMDGDGLTFQNGLRRLQLDWQSIQEVIVQRASWGKRVEVIGPRSHFQFRTLGEVKVHGEVKGRLGFIQGEEILKGILEKSDLTVVEKTGEQVRYARM